MNPRAEKEVLGVAVRVPVVRELGNQIEHIYLGVVSGELEGGARREDFDKLKLLVDRCLYQVWSEGFERGYQEGKGEEQLKQEEREEERVLNREAGRMEAELKGFNTALNWIERGFQKSGTEG